MRGPFFKSGGAKSSGCPTYPSELEVEGARVAHRLAHVVPAPERSGCRLAVGAGHAVPPRRRLEAKGGGVTPKCTAPFTYDTLDIGCVVFFSVGDKMWGPPAGLQGAPDPFLPHFLHGGLPATILPKCRPASCARYIVGRGWTAKTNQ